MEAAGAAASGRRRGEGAPRRDRLDDTRLALDSAARVTYGSTMEPSSSLASALRSIRDAILDDLVVAVPAAVPFYAAMTPDALRVLGGRLADLILDNLVDFHVDAVRAFGFETFSRRQKQGGKLGDALAVVRVLRRVLLSRAWDVGASAPETRRAVERIDAIFDTIVEAAAPVFERNLDEARAATELIEARYRDLYHRTPAMMHSADAQGRITAVSERWLEALGYSMDEVLGRSGRDFLTEESIRRAIDENKPRLVAEGKLRGVPCQFIKKSGEVMDTRLSISAIPGEAGAPAQYTATFDDVTAELRAERALRESEERWRSLMDLAPLPMCIHRDGVVLWVNDATVRAMRARSAEELIGTDVLDSTHPDDRASVTERLRIVQGSDELLPMLALRIIRRDGTVFPAEIVTRPIVHHGERVMMEAFVDVTARVQAEEARRVSEAQARVIEAQEEALRALSTPLIPLGDGVLILPIVGRVTQERADRILSALAEGVAAQSAAVAIVDVTGVPEADAGVARALLRVAQAIRLLGAEVVITGIQPAIARVLVDMGQDLSGMATMATLRDGIGYATRRRRGGGGPERARMS